MIRFLMEVDMMTEMSDTVDALLRLHKPAIRKVAGGEVETCESCSQMATMECSEYVHLIEYPCPTVLEIHKTFNSSMSKHDMGVMIVRLNNHIAELEETIERLQKEKNS